MAAGKAPLRIQSGERGRWCAADSAACWLERSGGGWRGCPGLPLLPGRRALNSAPIEGDKRFTWQTISDTSSEAMSQLHGEADGELQPCIPPVTCTVALQVGTAGADAESPRAVVRRSSGEEAGDAIAGREMVRGTPPCTLCSAASYSSYGLDSRGKRHTMQSLQLRPSIESRRSTNSGRCPVEGCIACCSSTAAACKIHHLLPGHQAATQGACENPVEKEFSHSTAAVCQTSGTGWARPWVIVYLCLGVAQLLGLQTLPEAALRQQRAVPAAPQLV